MTREKFAGILMVVLFVSVLAIAGCNDSDHDAAAPAALSTYAEDVAECMPQVTAA